MDRDETVRLLRLSANNRMDRISIVEALKVVTDYCLEKGKRGGDIARLRGYLARDMALLTLCTTQALEYFERKFTIYRLWSAPNPLNNQGQERKLLLIF